MIASVSPTLLLSVECLDCYFMARTVQEQLFNIIRQHLIIFDALRIVDNRPSLTSNLGSV